MARGIAKRANEMIHQMVSLLSSDSGADDVEHGEKAGGRQQPLDLLALDEAGTSKTGHQRERGGDCRKEACDEPGVNQGVAGSRADPFLLHKGLEREPPNDCRSHQGDQNTRRRGEEAPHATNRRAGPWERPGSAS